MRLAIQPFGNVPVEVVEALSKDLEIFGMQIEIRNSMSLPGDAYSAERGQYNADPFMEMCAQVDGERVLGVAAVDIYADSLNFVFGQAQVSGRTAVISIARLVDRDREKFRCRVTKEAVHELGHTLGLSHCSDSRCVMFFSNSLEDTDRKGMNYCHRCIGALPRALRPRRMSLGSC